MRLDLFDYELPGELIAEHPTPERDAARLLVHDAAREETRHGSIRDLPDLLDPRDLLVVNDTRVLPARLFGRRASGGAVELLLLEPEDPDWTRWSALVNPARKPRPGERIALAGGHIEARMLRRAPGAEGRPGKEWFIELTDRDGQGIRAALERHGGMPLPPYIHRENEPEDRERYQTVYAERPGAVAAPTAGLHFTPELLAEIDRRGVRRVSVTLHVGLGTFEPIECEEVEDHVMHSERFELTREVAQAVRDTRAAGGRVVCVGTTSVRVLESCVGEDGEIEARSGTTRLFLHPGNPPHVVDALLTNFHLPRSSLIVLVAAFLGRERLLALYREAVRERYRFFSYGDAMFVSRARRS